MLWQLPLLDRLIQLYKPQSDLLLILLTPIRAANLQQKSLNEPSHVTEYTNAYNFDEHLIEVLVIGIARNIPVSNRREARHHPVDRCDVKTRKIRILRIIVQLLLNPPYSPFRPFLCSNMNP